MSGVPRPVLRITRRCLAEDLGMPASVGASPEELADKDPLIGAFCAQRGQNPDGQEVVRHLTSQVVVWTLHSGEYRGATWHDKDAGIVWLLASRFHRSGDADDAYPYFRQLDENDELLPTETDYLDYHKAQAILLPRVLLEELPAMRRIARELSGTIYSGLLGGRIRLRLLHDAKDPPTLTVGLSNRLEPGEMPIPEKWQIVVLAAVFPTTDPGEVSFTPCIGDEAPRSDEVCYWAEWPEEKEA